MTTTTEPESSIQPEQAPKARSLRRRVLSRISIQSKLLMMLLLTSILSAAVVGAIGFQSGRTSMRASAFDRLTEIRESQSRQLESKFSDLEDSLIVYTRGATTTEAIEAFTAGFDQLNNATISPPQWQSVVDYYKNQFEKTEEEQTGNRIDVNGLLPTSNAEKYLQAYYTAPFTDWDKSIRFDDAGDGSAWSAANARFNDFFREIVLRFAFEDALLLDTRGNVVYSAYKGVDLGTNVFTGPYRQGGLRDAYEKALASHAVDYVGVTDFGDYQPAGEPTAWTVSPVGPPGRAEGVLALQFPISKISKLMTVDRQWETAGMGKTGETFLLGPDDLMTQSEQEELLPHTRLARYGTDEYVQFAGQVPKRMSFIVSGRVRLVVSGDDGAVIPVRTLSEGDFLGQTALTREAVAAAAYALEEVTVLQIERDYTEELVARKPVLLQDIGRAIEERRASLRRALAAADD